MLGNKRDKVGRELVIRLYVAGRAPTSVRALNNLQTIVDANEGVAWQIEVVDVLVEPLRALADGVLVTPTLIRVFPQPEVWIVGDLSRQVDVCGVLDVDMTEQDNATTESA